MKYKVTGFAKTFIKNYPISSLDCRNEFPSKLFLDYHLFLPDTQPLVDREIPAGRSKVLMKQTLYSK